MRSKLYLFLLFCIVCIESFAQLPKDSVQAMFMVGNFVSFKDNIACYRLKGIKDGGMYGFCRYDSIYEPNISSIMTSWDKTTGNSKKVLNSRCYTFIAPIYDYALPFNEGWAPVCINKKWTYVSLDGEYLCDFVFDAAYPFKNGKATVIFEGNSYEINYKGEGLPDIIRRETTDLSIELKGHTINQLCSEAQYEKAVTDGNAAYRDITTIHNGYLPELSADNLISAVQIAFATMDAQNKLMSSSLKITDIFNKYRTIPIERRISYESGHPAINRYNSELYFLLFEKIYGKECSDIFKEISRKDYKSAIVKFEKWANQKSINLTGDYILLMSCYYLSELSNDFETANRLLISISSNYEEIKEALRFNDQALCVVLADIKKYNSAEGIFLNQMRNERDNSDEKLFCLYYNLALMYKSANDEKNSIDCFRKAMQYNLPNNMEDIRLECISELLNSQLRSNTLDHNLLDEYVNSEILYNTNLFESENTIVLNRIWGNSIQRMQRILCYLDSPPDMAYLKSAFVLSVFQQSIPFDSEKYLAKTISSIENIEYKQLYDKFLEDKSEFRGIDIFDLITSDDKERENIYNLYELEKNIKDFILKTKGHYIPTETYKRFYDCNIDMVDVVQYQDTCSLYKYGAFVNSNNGTLSYAHLSFYDEFSRDDFWERINLTKHFKPQDDIYVHYGVLDTLGLEYSDYEYRIPFCEYKLHRSSTPSGVTSNRNSNSKNNIVLYGGLDYGDDIVSLSRGASKGYLENSIIEIEEIAKILDEYSMNVQIKTDDEGTIESFYELSGESPRILHLATHGYNYPRQNVNNFRLENFLLKERFNYYRQTTDIQQREWLMNNTGLLMSRDSKDENVLYANKVASSDLSETELVVLSACSTISGSTSDGNTQSIGLTTAFSLASAKNIITSLRDVDDQKTCEFMVTFYNFLGESNNIYESFRATVNEMKHKYPQNSEYWNSFVLVEN